MAERKIRLGIVGAGRMGITHHAILNAHPDVEVAGVADPSSVMTSLLEKYVKVRTYKSLPAMQERERLDAVLVCTPPAHNYQILGCALEHGLHVFAEKPFLLSAAQGAELAQRFRERGLVNQVGYVNRFNDVFLKAKSLIEGGVIDEVIRFRSEMFSSTVLRPESGEGWRSSHASGGGAVYEMAAHALDLINFLFGPPHKVFGSALSQVYSKSVEDVASCGFTYRGGPTGSLYVNWSDTSYRKPANKLEVFGRGGKLLADQHGLQLHLDQADSGRGFTAGWNQLHITDVFSNVPFYVRGIEFTAQLYHFVDCVKAGGSTPARCSFTDGAAVLGLIEEIFKDASSSGRGLQPS